MKLIELETIYKISDALNSGYTAWYGTIDDIVEYLDAQKDNIQGYDLNRGWVYNLEKYGLSFESIN